jgi:hypothetical protein
VASKIESVGNVRAEGGRFAVRWIELQPRQRKFSRTDREAVEAKRRELLEAVEGAAESIDLSDLRLDGTSQSWSAAIRAASNRALEAAAAGEEAVQRRLELLARTLATLSKEALAHARIEELEDQLEAANEYIDSLRRQAADKHMPASARTTGPESPFGDEPPPDDKLN